MEEKDFGNVFVPVDESEKILFDELLQNMKAFRDREIVEGKVTYGDIISLFALLDGSLANVKEIMKKHDLPPF